MEASNAASAIPTNFSYLGLISDLGRGWKLDLKPYTYGYRLLQWFTKTPPLKTTTGGIDASCATPVKGILPCADRQINACQKFGEVGSISQASQYGVFRAGLWYEWAGTHRYNYPTNPLTGAWGSLPNYREYFTTNSYQAFAEYSYRAIPKLTVTAGFKYAHYVQDMTQFPDNGTTIGTPPSGVATVHTTAHYNSPLPTAAINYRIRRDWSAYVQFAQGSAIPPNGVLDVTYGTVIVLPKPTRTTAYQVGTVLKLKRVMFDSDFYRIKFQNADSSSIGPNGETVYYLNPDAVTIGGEMETNVAITSALSVYANGSVGRAQYSGSGVPSGLWVANTPSYTEGSGVTYQQRNLDLGIFQKLIAPMWSDNGSYHSQVQTNSFNMANVFLNYTVRNYTHFDGTKIGLSINNLFNSEEIVGLKPAAAPVPTIVNGVKSPYLATTASSGGDLLTLTPGRSIMLSVTFGLQRRR